MTATVYRIVAVLTACTLLAATGCKKKDDKASKDAQALALQDAGVVFRDGFMEQTIPGMTRGVRPASKLHADCAGFIGKEATSEISFVDEVPMRIHVTADDDLVLVIEGSDEVFCNDDFDGHQPSLARKWKAGKYSVYVGTKEQSDSDVLYELNFDHYDPSRPLEPTPGRLDADAEADADDPSDDSDTPSYEPVLLENPSPLIRVARGTLPFDVNTTPRFETYPFVPNGIAQHPLAIEKDTLDSRTTVVDEASCPALVDAKAPDFWINMLAEGDIHISAVTNQPVALVFSSKSDRVYCALPNESNQATLRVENLPEGKYALRIATLVERNPEKEDDAEAEDASDDTAMDDSEADDAQGAVEDTHDAPEDRIINGTLHLY